MSEKPPALTTVNSFPAELFCLFVGMGLMGLAAVLSHGDTEMVRGVGLGALCVFAAWALSFLMRMKR